MATIEPEATLGLDPSLIIAVDVGPRTSAQQLAMAVFMDIAPLEVPPSRNGESGAQVESEEADYYREEAERHQPGTRPPWLVNTEVHFEPDVEREEIKERLRYKRDGDHTLPPYR